MANTPTELAAGADFPDSDRNRESQERAKRLRSAVKAAGGNQAVADRIGMPVGTLNRYMAGRDMKASALVALADACNVSLEWLGTGRAPMRPGEPPPEPHATRASRPTSSNLFGTLDIDRMARAIEKALELFAERGHRPSMRRLAQVVLLLYDDFVDPAQQDRGLSGFVLHDEGDRDEPG